MDRAVIASQPRVDLGGVQDLARSPGHVDTAPQLIEPLRDRADCLCLILRRLIGRKAPRIEKRNLRIEHAGMDIFANADFADAARIAIDSVKVVVRHEGRVATPKTRGRHGDDRRRQAFEPSQCVFIAFRQRAACGSPCDERLKQTRGRRRPIADAVITSVMKADGEKKAARHGSAHFALAFLSGFFESPTSFCARVLSKAMILLSPTPKALAADSA